MFYVVLLMIGLSVGAFLYFRKHRDQLAALEKWAKEMEEKVLHHSNKSK